VCVGSLCFGTVLVPMGNCGSSHGEGKTVGPVVGSAGSIAGSAGNREAPDDRVARGMRNTGNTGTTQTLYTSTQVGVLRRVTEPRDAGEDLDAVHVDSVDVDVLADKIATRVLSYIQDHALGPRLPFRVPRPDSGENSDEDGGKPTAHFGRKRAPPRRKDVDSDSDSDVEVARAVL
jgi:hypothetical protein